jgi:hypothetical protein
MPDIRRDGVWIQLLRTPSGVVFSTADSTITEGTFVQLNAIYIEPKYLYLLQGSLVNLWPDTYGNAQIPMSSQ